MGILNATPDSFSDGGKFNAIASAMDRVHIMLSEGASIIDIGGESTRPNAEPVSEEEELARVIPILKKVIPTFEKAIYSIDTTKFEVAKQALELGVKIVNDVSGLEKEPNLANLCADFDATYVLMHTQGDPKTMQRNPTYKNVTVEVFEFFERKIEVLQSKGVKKIILDPGIGFGKTLEHNLSLIAHLDYFKKIGFPVLVGASRKSMIGKILDDRPENERLTGTIAVHYHSLVKGADLLRVHDVKEASDSIRIFNAIQSQS
ncbi:MAG: dihydropteroate synthase [Balneolaceae bacterium]|nr:dihydropteroate synthase [Balneolaceae bacterium]MBO6545178.1 dihydropteroate synthase [Balneolaceae bacterium]MBO6646574.1 dihydropteroate synthase [Balneolaceae bacterium]